MKLVLAIVQQQDAPQLLAALTEQQFRVTQIASQGGFLREGNATLMLSLTEANVDRVIDIIHTHCSTRTRYIAPVPPLAETGEFYPASPIEVQVGGATVFVLDAQEQRL